MAIPNDFTNTVRYKACRLAAVTVAELICQEFLLTYLAMFLIYAPSKLCIMEKKNIYMNRYH